jgi:hypothetical protein
MIPIMLSEDFEKVINHCNTCKSSYSINNTVEGLLMDNTELDKINLYYLMELIEEKHPAVKKCDLKFYLEEINFNEKKFRFANPKIVYLYTCVINEYEKLLADWNSTKPKEILSQLISKEQVKISAQIAPEVEKDSGVVEKIFDDNKTFYSTFSKEDLRYIGQLFADNDIMPKEDIEYFVDAFSEIPIPKKIEKIHLKLEYNGKVNNQALVIILNRISPKEMASNPHKVSKIKVNQLFSFTKPFSINSTSFENAIKKKEGKDPKDATIRKVLRILNSQ